MQDVLQQFKDLGQSASFHFADDSGKEWDLAWRDQRAAELLFQQHPDLQAEMVAIAKGFLWTLNVEKLLNQ